MTIRFAAAHMKRRRSGSIIATASIAGLRSEPLVGYGYVAAKAAVGNIVRHAAVDLASTIGTPPAAPDPDRLPPEDLARLRVHLAGRGVMLATGEEAEEVLGNLRASYEPYVNSLSKHLQMRLPTWLPAEGAMDNWEVTAWEIGSGRRIRRDIDPPSDAGRAQTPKR